MSFTKMRNYHFTWHSIYSIFLLDDWQSMRCLLQIVAHLSNEAIYGVSCVICVVSDAGKAHQLNSKQAEVRGALECHSATQNKVQDYNYSLD